VDATTGVVTAEGAGTATITATADGFNGPVTSSATITVTGGSGTGPTSSSVVSLAIIPDSQSVASPQETSQFIAIGTTSSGATVDLTGQATWVSSSTQIATVGSPEKTGTIPGLATAVNQGTTTITALYSNTTQQTVVTGTATFTVSGGASEPFTSLSVSPSSQSLSQSGQYGSFVAIATSGSTGLQEDVTNSPDIKWVSSIPTVASITSGLATGSGVAQGVSPGTTAITAELTNPADSTVLTATATVTVTTTAPPEPLLSLTIIPSSISVGNLQDTGNFMAIGTFSSPPYVQDLTNSVIWSSSAPNVFPVSSDNATVNPGAPGGIVTAYGNGNAVIIAEASSGGSIQTATATFACPLVEPCPACVPPVAGSCFPGSQAPGLLVTLTVYNEGLNTTNWVVTAPSATGTQDVLHCGPGWAGAGGSICTATYPLGTTVTLTATQNASDPGPQGTFGGWSWDCTPVAPITAAGPNSCTVTLGDITSPNPTNTTDVSVGAIFN
jgi:hypothetical protein